MHIVHMPATHPPSYAIERALRRANEAAQQYNLAVDTLSPSAADWDRIATRLTAAADALKQVAKTVEMPHLAGIVNRIRVRAEDATTRASRQRAIAAIQAAAALAGMADFVEPSNWSVQSTMEVGL